MKLEARKSNTVQVDEEQQAEILHDEGRSAIKSYLNRHMGKGCANIDPLNDEKESRYCNKRRK